MIPTCETMPREPATESGRRNCETAGATRPRSDGPSRIPASTSPMTGGWPSARKILPTARAATITTASASKVWKSRCPPPPARAAGGGGTPAGAGATSDRPAESTQRKPRTPAASRALYAVARRKFTLG